ncbi:MAG: protein-L-isoaspartate(D-aspartate) O-methyltransferase [Deltaproteobacteria bacterium]|nr:protein-L-isoaspartate(D-aspartate) O-methyltransferase [Deltaproteobacteria bacterium]
MVTKRRSSLLEWGVGALIIVPLVLVSLQAVNALAEQKGEARFRILREAMVREQIADPPDYRRPVRNRRVLQAMGTVPRHLFVKKQDIPWAYRDHPLPIGHGQTISQPYIVALMSDLLDVTPEQRVLEVGTGSGYQAAILSRLVKDVFTVEIIEVLAQQADARLERLGYRNVHVKMADGYYGWKAHAPFDRIIVTAAATLVPPPLIRQLKPGGKMCIPVGARYAIQYLTMIDKSETGDITMRKLLPVRFVPLTRTLR